MSTIQVEKQRLLTFEEICPWWSKEIARCGGSTIWSYLSKEAREKITRGACCVVGEAHGGTDEYDCDECRSFSYGQSINNRNEYSKYQGPPFTAVEHWSETIPQFVKHWNEVHVPNT